MAFKRRSKELSNKLNEQMAALETGKKQHEDDSTEWKLTLDKVGNGNALIRFLPNIDDTKVAFIQKYNHGFQDKSSGKWFIENCATTIGGQCPLCTLNSELWSTGIDANKKIASNRKRKLSYWSNIYVIKDKANPDSEGKVFKFRFGKKLYEKIMEQREENPDLGESSVEVECVYEGANFSLITQKVDGYQNYDKSKFGQQTALLGGDEKKLEEVFNSLHDINLLIAPSEFKSEEEFSKNLHNVIGAKSKSVVSAAETLDSAHNDDNDDDEEINNQINSAKMVDEDSATEDLDKLLSELENS